MRPEGRADTSGFDRTDWTDLLSVPEPPRWTLDELIDGVMVVDPSWQITFAHVRSNADVVGHDLRDVFADAVGTDLWDWLEKSMRAETTQTFEARHGPLDGWFEIRAHPSPSGLALYFQDIHERRAAFLAQEARVARLEATIAQQVQTQSIVAALAESLSVDDIASAVLKLARQVLGTMFAGIALLNDDDTAVRFVILDPLPPEVVADLEPVPLDVPSALGDCVRLRRPVYHSSRAGVLATYPAPVGAPEMIGNEAFANVPLLVGGRVLGALSMSWTNPRTFSDLDRAFVRILAAQCAQAVERAQLSTRQRDVAETLQQAMLPDELPTIDGVALSACYLPAMTDMTVGGDWYDAFTLADGRLVFAVGDVSGHGVKAAAMMGQVRNSLRAYVYEGHSPAIALAKLDELIDRGGHGLFATVAAGVYDPTSGDLVWSSAGHPPLILRSGATARLLGGHVGAPIGVRGPQGYRDEHVRLQAGELLVGYTDGLVERRREDLDDGFARLTSALAAAGDLTAAPDWCTTLVDRVLGSALREDDICVLALQRG
jgi:serine phosphatase RsbU (regulator of sigma subunit)